MNSRHECNYCDVLKKLVKANIKPIHSVFVRLICGHIRFLVIRNDFREY